jgi:hypothetical protein
LGVIQAQNGPVWINRVDPSRRQAAAEKRREENRTMKISRPSPGLVLLLAILVGSLVFVIWAFGTLWRMAGNTTMSVHGWIAMSLAAIFTLGLGGGLMWLAFYSSRHGYDEQAQRPDDEDR